MQPFRIKAKVQWFVLGLIMIGLIMVAGNVSLAVNKNAVESEINDHFKHDIAIGRAFYIFPNTIHLNDVRMIDQNGSRVEREFVLSRITLRFSLWKLLTRGGMQVSHVILSPSRVSYYALSSFLQKNFQEILEIIRNSPGNDIKVHVKETLLDFDREGQPDYIAVQLRLAIADEIMKGVGYFRADQYDYSSLSQEYGQRVAQGWPLWYKLESRLRPDGIDVAQLIFKSGTMHAKLWGHVRSDRIKVNGFAFLNRAKDALSEEDYSSTRYFRHFPEDQDLDQVDTYILDIDGRVALAYPDAQIERFQFTVNDIPVTLKGALSLREPFAFTSELSADADEDGKESGVFFKNLEARLDGEWKNKMLLADGLVRIDFRERDGVGPLLESGEANLKGMAIYKDWHKRFRVDVGQTRVLYRTNAKEHRIAVDDTEIVGKTRGSGPKPFGFKAPFYGGEFNGLLIVNDAHWPWTFNSTIEINNVKSSALEELLVHFAKFNGRLFGDMQLTNVPHLTLSGNLILTEGTMTDVAFFDWLSDTFRLPELKAIGFARASTDFLIDPQRIELHGIHLNTEDVRIGGYFDVDDQNLVTSKLRLGLSQEMLGRSVKFRPVMKIFGEEEPFLDFEFQLSGNMGAMNFQWLPNEVKRKIQKRIPDFVERLIERGVDQMMDP